jgi:hypothetical protein
LNTRELEYIRIGDLISEIVVIDLITIVLSYIVKNQVNKRNTAALRVLFCRRGS